MLATLSPRLTHVPANEGIDELQKFRHSIEATISVLGVLELRALTTTVNT